MMPAHKLPSYEELMKHINTHLFIKPQHLPFNPPPKSTRLEWSAEDISLLFEKHQEMGNMWTAISKCFPNKTENIVKNYFYSSLRKLCRKIKKGILPKLDDPKCSLNVSHYYHLLDYLLEVCNPHCTYKRAKRRDFYLVGMLDTKSLTVNSVEQYKMKLMAYANLRQSCNKLKCAMSFVERMPLLIMPHKAIQQKLEEIQWYLLKKRSKASQESLNKFNSQLV